MSWWVIGIAGLAGFIKAMFLSNAAYAQDEPGFYIMILAFVLAVGKTTVWMFA